MFGGAMLININCRLLGGKVNFFHAVCLLGYCVFPINLAALFLKFVGTLIPIHITFLLRFAIMAGACLWSILCNC